MKSFHKILPFNKAESQITTIRKGKIIVQCHGTFDLIHPGHIAHLEEAKSLGDILVVTITEDAFVSKGPGRPCFHTDLRTRSLAALECVDYVVAIPFPAAVEAIDLIKPEIYCKGKEYEDPTNDNTGNIHNDVKSVIAHGGVIKYIGGVVFSSSKLLNKHFDHLSDEVKEYCIKLRSDEDPKSIQSMIKDFSKLKVAVIGDTIIDQYVNVSVQGLTSKNKILSGHFINEETFLGGALAVFRHVKQFTDNVRYVSLLGGEDWIKPLISGICHKEFDYCVEDANFTTPVKRRYVLPAQEGNEMTKLFSVNFIKPTPSESSIGRLKHKIQEAVKDADVVLLLDFGHGMMEQSVRELVQESSPFLCLNCQSNSFNHGFNIISRQYSRADAFSLDNSEMMLVCGERKYDEESELSRLKSHLNANYAWLTKGDVMTMGLHTSEDPAILPPFEPHIIDTVGAGDAFFSVAALAAASGASGAVSTFLGQLAGAQAVRIVGNKTPISKNALLGSVSSLLNF